MGVFRLRSNPPLPIADTIFLIDCTSQLILPDPLVFMLANRDFNIGNLWFLRIYVRIVKSECWEDPQMLLELYYQSIPSVFKATSI